MKGKSKSSLTSASVQSLRNVMASPSIASIRGGSPLVNQDHIIEFTNRGNSAIELVLERQTDEHGHAEIIVVEEGAKAPVPVARPDQPQLIEEEHRARGQAGVVPAVRANHPADQVQRRQRH